MATPATTQPTTPREQAAHEQAHDEAEDYFVRIVGTYGLDHAIQLRDELYELRYRDILAGK